MTHADYSTLFKQLKSLTEGETDTIALMATTACEIHHADDRFDWTGYYRVTEPKLLKIGPYQGGHGCLQIPFHRGVCGRAATTEQVQIVDDVNSFDGHIACSSSTLSEIVLPVHNAEGALIAVLDIDSNKPAAFTKNDADELTKILQAVFGSKL
jgi:GAF domain-containing protein